jgi:hypothetical protein
MADNTTEVATPPPLVDEAAVQWLTLPATLADAVGIQSAAFYRPKAGHTLGTEDIYAVRCNENYVDIKAVLENERAYVRMALFRATKIFFYRCVGKQPLILMGHFDATAIKDGSRAIEAAVLRTTEAKSQKCLRIEVQKPVDPRDKKNLSRKLFRVIGSAENVASFVKECQPFHYASAKPHFVPGVMVAHAFLCEEALLDFKTFPSLYKTLLFEKVDNIVSSSNSAKQLTLRNPAASIDDVAAVGLRLQEYGCFATLRSNGTLRITIHGDSPVTADTVKALRGIVGLDWKIFTDTPINVWQRDRESIAAGPRAPAAPKKQGPPREPQVEQALAEGDIVVKISADHVVHPLDFVAIANFMNGTVIQHVISKYNDTPLAALIRAPPAQEANIQGLLDEPFSIDEMGQWHAVRVRPPRV